LRGSSEITSLQFLSDFAPGGLDAFRPLLLLLIVLVASSTVGATRSSTAHRNNTTLSIVLLPLQGRLRAGRTAPHCVVRMSSMVTHTPHISVPTATETYIISHSSAERVTSRFFRRPLTCFSGCLCCLREYALFVAPRPTESVQSRLKGKSLPSETKEQQAWHLFTVWFVLAPCFFILLIIFLPTRFTGYAYHLLVKSVDSR